MSRKQNKPTKPSAMVDTRLKSALLWSRVLLLIASGVAAYLLVYAVVQKPMAGCGPGSPCDRVMGSPWAYWLDIPVSAPALAAYLALLFCTFEISKSRTPQSWTRSWTLTLPLCAAVLGAAVWFTGLQILVLKTMCKFCTAAHLSSVLAVILLIRAAPRIAPDPHLQRARPALGSGRFAGLVLFGLLLSGGLALGQKLAPHRTNIVKIHDGSFRFDLREVPLIGSAKADKYIVSLFDYTCPDCHTMHEHLLKARQKLNDQFSIVSLPLPLDSRCNHLIRQTMPKHLQACDYAKLGLAVRLAGQDQFQKFDDWFFTQTGTAKFEEARKKAEELVPGTTLDKNLQDPWIDKMIQTSVSIYSKNQQLTRSLRVPQLIIGNVVNLGPVANDDELVTLLRRNLALD